ncbi:hypothetical protein QQS21_004602 [Conoideocrella luteorostrata]|uniref:Uncharacterized protein n=1 Tax=Conoideocrella luteorostrata TaxID=1105319 RepID=A0AAJ0CS00_9HYPO|nr:hypothetical protein QQS21_004602 [Conoideocrella luteorostrata]
MKEITYATHSLEMNVIIESIFKSNKPKADNKMQQLEAAEATVDTAIRNMKIVISTYQYIRNGDITKILGDQVKRVGDNLKRGENVVASNDPSYSKNSLKDAWLRFVKTRTEQAMGQLTSFLDTWMPKIEDVLKGTDEKEDAYHPGRDLRSKKIVKLREVVDTTKNSWTTLYRMWVDRKFLAKC